MMTNAKTPFIGFHAASEQFAPGELVELGVAAEAAGFDGLTVSDHFHPWQDNQGHAGNAWLMLAAIGQRTERLTLGTAVTCPSYRRHPSQVAHAFATLGLLYPGRVFLGVGTGEALNESPTDGGWGPYRERAARLVEAIQIIKRLWNEEWVDFEGEHLRVRGARLYDKPQPPIPLYMAASGPRSGAIAGREADGWITDPGTARRPEVREAFTKAAQAAGKDVAKMPRIVESYVVVGEREEALAVAPLWQFLPIYNKVVGVDDPREVQRIAEELSSPERVVDTWLVSTKPEDHIAGIEELVALGTTHIFIHSPQADQRRVIDFYSRHVLPALRGR